MHNDNNNDNTTDTIALEARAIRLLERYDRRKKGLHLLERELAKAAREYGLAKGCRAYSADNLRNEVHNIRRFARRA